MMLLLSEPDYSIPAMAKHFGQFIQRKRQEKYPDMSQEEFAAKVADVSRSTQQTAERSESYKVVKERQWSKIAAGLKTTFDRLLVEFGQPRIELRLRIPHELYGEILAKIVNDKQRKWDQDDVDEFIESAVREKLAGVAVSRLRAPSSGADSLPLRGEDHVAAGVVGSIAPKKNAAKDVTATSRTPKPNRRPIDPDTGKPKES